jgi:hypothetical protein
VNASSIRLGRRLKYPNSTLLFETLLEGLASTMKQTVKVKVRGREREKKRGYLNWKGRSKTVLY